ncbi:uncharacterized protein LOC124652759 [Lolium rigidum]|uniref:uncharacterized protein LOC124652759 n=1 Tax=Lolium rigidum TaxID=89674 RepID=UPI001F5C2B0F|nr:uncharacterized protein LOC124652759 [Lolium rigidum]
MESDPNSNQEQQHRILLPSDTDSATATEAAAKADHGEQDADLDLDPVVIEGEEVKVEKKRSSRKVRFNDCSLTQVLEFQPSTQEDAISLCAQLCTWLCGQRPET